MKLITGDEILKADLRDSNSYYLIQKFTELGHPVSQVVILGDDLMRYLLKKILQKILIF